MVGKKPDGQETRRAAVSLEGADSRMSLDRIEAENRGMTKRRLCGFAVSRPFAGEEANESDTPQCILMTVVVLKWRGFSRAAKCHKIRGALAPVAKSLLG